MPNKQLGMEKIRQVLRCYTQGYGTKNISSMLTVSRNTVRKYLQVFQHGGLDYEGVVVPIGLGTLGVIPRKDQSED